jgi:integrase
MSRAGLKPVVTAMLTEWCPPSTPQWMTTAHRVIEQVLSWLQSQPGDTWQARWLASGAEMQPRTWPALAGVGGRQQIETAQFVVNALVIIRAVAPTLGWLVGTARVRLRDDWTIYHDAELFTTLRARVEAAGSADRAESIAHLYRMSVTTSHGLSDLTAADFRATHAALVQLGKRKGSLNATWRHVKALGLLCNEPDELSQVLAKARLSPKELVDRYGVRDKAIGRLLVEYLTEREATCDYTTLQNIALHIVKLFWVELEEHEPGIRSLALSREQAYGWKRRLQTLPTGAPRKNWPAAAQNVRSFYLDLAVWAQDDPERWAKWVAPCPIGNRELRALGPRRRRRQIAEMNARTRSLSPVLPQLVSSVTSEHRRAEHRLLKALTAQPEAVFSVGSEKWRRCARQDPSRRRFSEFDVVAISDSGQRINLTKAEDRAFWTWAIVEVLRHTGIRIEELLELTHLSLRPFRQPDGKIIPLLQIAPSKSDAERMLPITPELAHVFSRIVLRHTTATVGVSDVASSPTVPLVSRWDDHERVHSAPLPYLFQRGFLIGRQSVISPGTVRNWLNAAVADADLRDNDGARISLSPHDFRRIFLTDAVRNGLPIHIAAQLAGHDGLNTTRRYAATYPTEVIDHYQKFIARRRAERPVEEYRPPTDEELKEFGEHFGRRRVELGNCVRPYGTGCTHEHACIRCSFLQIEPTQSDRLAEIESDLTERIDEPPRDVRRLHFLGRLESCQVVHRGGIRRSCVSGRFGWSPRSAISTTRSGRRSARSPAYLVLVARRRCANGCARARLMSVRDPEPRLTSLLS